MKERNANLDLIRVWSMICVLLMHTPGRPWLSIPVLGWIVNCFIVACNSHFFMLSGQMNLGKVFPDKKSYREYYLKRLITVIFPYLLITVMLTLWNIRLEGGSFEMTGCLKRMYRDLMADNGVTHLWFMYALIGMIISAPFLSRMVHAMEDWELSLMMAVGLLWGVVSIYMTEDLGVGFAYTGWFLSGWLLTFTAGYYCDRVIKAPLRPRLYAAGIAGLAITAAGCSISQEHFLHALDLSPVYVLFVMAWYVFLKDQFVVSNEKVKKCLTFMARHTFTIYLIHYVIIHNITVKLFDLWKIPYHYVLSFLITFGLSLASAIVLDHFIIIPVQRKLRRILL